MPLSEMKGVVLIYTAVVCILSIEFCISARANLGHEGGNHKEETERIVHGKVAPEGKYPFMASIYIKSWTHEPKFICGGSILNPDYILTACHCIRDSQNEYVELRKYVAAAGDQHRHSPSADIQIRPFVKVLGHPNCNMSQPKPFTSDLGLIQVEFPFKMNDKLKPVHFITSQRDVLWWWYSKFVSERKHCEIPGWGRTHREEAEKPLKLQEGIVELMNAQECLASICYIYHQCSEDVAKKKNICAAVSQGSSPCSGDSGGPLMCGGYIFAVFSSGSSNCQPTTSGQKKIQKPVHFTNPLETLEFVQQNIPNYEGSTPTFDPHSSKPPFKYPFVVSIANVSDKLIPRSLCAASILTVSSVLTTCRCLRQLTYSHEQHRFLDVAVISGVTDLFEDSLLAQHLDIIKIHTDYSCTPYKFNFLYDSGVAVLNGKFTSANSHLKPLQMMTEDISKLRVILRQFQKSSLECVMVTWGYEYDHPTRIRYNIFSEWKVRLFNTQKCQRIICSKEGDNCYEAFNRSAEICGEAYNLSQPCYGDGGGPVICNGYYFGLVSHNYELCVRSNTVKITTVIPILEMIQTQFSTHKIKTLKVRNLEVSAGNLIPLSGAILWIVYLLTVASTVFSFYLR